jgi:hypothetical protein
MAGSPCRSQRETGRHPCQSAEHRRSGPVIRSPVWAVSGDLLLVAAVRVDRSSDRDDQDCAGTRNFNATLNAYFPGLSSKDSMSAWPSSSMLRILNFETLRVQHHCGTSRHVVVPPVLGTPKSAGHRRTSPGSFRAEVTSGYTQFETMFDYAGGVDRSVREVRRLRL